MRDAAQEGHSSCCLRKLICFVPPSFTRTVSLKSVASGARHLATSAKGARLTKPSSPRITTFNLKTRGSPTRASRRGSDSKGSEKRKCILSGVLTIVGQLEGAAAKRGTFDEIDSSSRRSTFTGEGRDLVSEVESQAEPTAPTSLRRSESEPPADSRTPGLPKLSAAASTSHLGRGSSKSRIVRDSASSTIDDFYISCIALQSMPVSKFNLRQFDGCPLPISSINEHQLLLQIGLPKADRCHIEGLKTAGVRRTSAFSAGVANADHKSDAVNEETLAARAIARLAADPPDKVGSLQRRSAHWLLRPFPHG